MGCTAFGPSAAEAMRGMAKIAAHGRTGGSSVADFPLDAMPVGA